MHTRRRYDPLFVIVPTAFLAIGYAIFGGPRLAIIAVGASAAVTGIGLVLARNVGKNEVYGTTAADAAAPRSQHARVGSPTTRLVSDRALAAMATTAFAPPDGISPWQGHVLLHEMVDRRTVDALVAELLATEVLQIEGSLHAERPGLASAMSDQILARGPRFADAAPREQAWAASLLGADGRVNLSGFDADYAVAIGALRKELKRVVDDSGWWKRRHTPPIPNQNVTANDRFGRGFSRVAGVLAAFVLMSIVAVSLPLRLPAPVAAAVTATISISCAFLAMLLRRWPERAADGSAYALQVESFRRFLDASEDAYVEHAWDHRTIREYSAWAIAISEADAWRSEVARAETVRFGDLATVIEVDRQHPELRLLQQPWAPTKMRLFRLGQRIGAVRRPPPGADSPDR